MNRPQKSLKFGLNIKKKPINLHGGSGDKPAAKEPIAFNIKRKKTVNVLEDDDDEDETTTISQRVNIELEKIAKRSTAKVEGIKQSAIEQDPNVFDYDAV